MSPLELWWFIEAKTPERTYGVKRPMSEAEVAEIYERAYGTG